MEYQRSSWAWLWLGLPDLLNQEIHHSTIRCSVCSCAGMSNSDSIVKPAEGCCSTVGAGISNSYSVVELGEVCHSIVRCGASSCAGMSNLDSIVEPGEECCSAVRHSILSCTGISGLDSVIEQFDSGSVATGKWED